MLNNVLSEYLSSVLRIIWYSTNYQKEIIIAYQNNASGSFSTRTGKDQLAMTDINIVTLTKEFVELQRNKFIRILTTTIDAVSYPVLT